MKPRSSSLTYILSVALLVAGAMLCLVIYRDYIRGEDVEVGERPRLAKSSYAAREARKSPADVPHPADVDVRAPLVADLASARGRASSEAPSTAGKVERSGQPTPRIGDAAPDRPAPPARDGGNLTFWTSDDIATEIASHLLELARGCQWPEDAFGKNGEFRIGVLRDEPMRRALNSRLHGDPVGGHPVDIVGHEHPKNLEGSLIVLVGDPARMTGARAIFDRRPMMTVSYSGPKLDDTWCDVELVLVEGRLGFAVDRSALARKGITVPDALFDSENVWLRENGGPIVRLRPVRSAPARKQRILW